VDQLYEKFPEFRMAYDVDGMTPAQFSSYGATVRTMRQFLGATNDLEALVRDVLLPNPG
jgi:transaldolase